MRRCADFLLWISLRALAIFAAYRLGLKVDARYSADWAWLAGITAALAMIEFAAVFDGAEDMKQESDDENELQQGT